MEAIKSAVTKKVWERAAFEFQEPPQNNNQEDQEQPQPEELRPEDVEQILEELSRQEKRIRAKEMEQNAGEPQDGKNW